jgi:hypothetical protein
VRIGVDIDDVLVDALPHFLAAFNARFGKAVPLEQADWDLFRLWAEAPLTRAGINGAAFAGGGEIEC